MDKIADDAEVRVEFQEFCALLPSAPLLALATSRPPELEGPESAPVVT